MREYYAGDDEALGDRDTRDEMRIAVLEDALEEAVGGWEQWMDLSHVQVADFDDEESAIDRLRALLKGSA